MAGEETRPEAGGEPCPTCGAPAQRGQLVCLECGGRIALGYRRPPSWKVPVAITLLALLVAGAAGFFGYRALTDDADKEVAETPLRVAGNEKDAKGSGDDGEKKASGEDREKELGAEGDEEKEKEKERTTTAEQETQTETTPEPEPEPEEDAEPAGDGIFERGGIYRWPGDLDAFTVVLLSTEDRASAESFARSAARSAGSEEVGVVRSDSFSTLGRGFFVVFAGEYPRQAGAQRAASRLAGRFPGAYAQRVAP